jgi:hypothetical protein
MNWDYILAIFIWISRGFYMALIVYYCILVLLVALLIIRQRVVKMIAAFNRRRFLAANIDSLNRNHSVPQKMRLVFQSSLLVNNFLAIMSMIFAFAVVTESNVEYNVKLAILVIVAGLIPFMWGYLKSTNIGVNSGTIGVLLGLFWLDFRIVQISWWDQALYFSFISILSLQSGWYGGSKGLGKIRDSMVTSVFKVNLEANGPSLRELIFFTQETIFNKVLRSKSNRIYFAGNEVKLVMLQGTAAEAFHGSLTNFEYKSTWSLINNPQLIAFRWLFEKRLVVHTNNEIIDCAFNFWRNITIKLIIIHSDEDDHTGIDKFYLIINSYNETPSIIWSNFVVESIALQIYQCILDALNNTNIEGISNQWKIKEQGIVVLRQWQPRITLEQYSKNTLAVANALVAIEQNRLNTEYHIPSYIQDDFFSPPHNVFSIRAVDFVLILIGQIILGIFINLLTNHIFL